MTEQPCRRRAAFSRCGTYRYALWREWDDGGTTLLVVALNPSTADHRRDDPTIRRCMRFARSWGFGRLVVANLFAYRATQPRDLRRATSPIGPRNDRWLRHLSAESSLILAAWGTEGDYLARAERARRQLGPLYCLGVTRNGAPRHPLYVRADTAPRPYHPTLASDALLPHSTP